MKNYKVILLNSDKVYDVNNAVMRMGDSDIVAFYEYNETGIDNSGDLILMVHMRNCIITNDD